MPDLPGVLGVGHLRAMRSPGHLRRLLRQNEEVPHVPPAHREEDRPAGPAGGDVEPREQVGREPGAVPADGVPAAGAGGGGGLRHLPGAQAQRGLSVRARGVHPVRPGPARLPHVPAAHHPQDPPLLTSTREGARLHTGEMMLFSGLCLFNLSMVSYPFGSLNVLERRWLPVATEWLCELFSEEDLCVCPATVKNFFAFRRHLSFQLTYYLDCRCCAVWTWKGAVPEAKS